ncbi:MAG: hypothetical protein IPJ88_03265 [Myxococcales bacterium]|nr:MAG: hypothetical protein IPJ88_03265 [Myxococcales bacterium]
MLSAAAAYMDPKLGWDSDIFEVGQSTGEAARTLAEIVQRTDFMRVLGDSYQFHLVFDITQTDSQQLDAIMKLWLLGNEKLALKGLVVDSEWMFTASPLALPDIKKIEFVYQALVNIASGNGPARDLDDFAKFLWMGFRDRIYASSQTTLDGLVGLETRGAHVPLIDKLELNAGIATSMENVDAPARLGSNARPYLLSELSWRNDFNYGAADSAVHYDHIFFLSKVEPSLPSAMKNSQYYYLPFFEWERRINHQASENAIIAAREAYRAGLDELIASLPRGV